jgi:hypothetical protein
MLVDVGEFTAWARVGKRDGVKNSGSYPSLNWHIGVTQRCKPHKVGAQARSFVIDAAPKASPGPRRLEDRPTVWRGAVELVPHWHHRASDSDPARLSELGHFSASK